MIDEELLKKVLHDAYLENKVDYPLEHREFVDRWIRKEERREELWNKIKTQLAVSSILAVGTYIVVVVWDSLKGH